MVSLWRDDGNHAREYLYQRVRENDAQEPQRNFLEDRRLIHDRRKNEPCIPFLPGHDQEAWFEKLDANEIWGRVFEYVTSPSDVTSAYFSCEMFRKHLEHKRKMMLLPKVFEVLRRNRFGERPDRLDVLNYRLVSKDWKKSAEDAFLLLTPPQPLWNPRSWYWDGPFVCRFRNVLGVNKALEKLTNPSTSASLLRMVEVNEKSLPQETRENFHAKLGELLDIHGGSVWGLEFNQIRTLGKEEFEYNVLRNLVFRMPQLKALKLKEFWRDGGVRITDESRDEILRRSHARSVSVMMHFPFPEISTLQLCQVERRRGRSLVYPEKNGFLLTEILKRCKNVKGLSMDGFSDDGDGDGGLWVAVKNLQLHYLHLESRTREEDLQGLKELQSPLHTLRVENYEDFLFASELFAVLNHFNESLVKFEMNFRPDYVFAREPVVVGDFPKLKCIELSRFDLDWA